MRIMDPENNVFIYSLPRKQLGLLELENIHNDQNSTKQ